MYMFLYWYRWTGQSGQVKLGYTTYESGKSTTYHIVFDPSFPETPALVYGLSHLDSTEYENVRITTYVNFLSKTGFNLTLNPGSPIWRTMLWCNGWSAQSRSDL